MKKIACKKALSFLFIIIISVQILSYGICNVAAYSNRPVMDSDNASMFIGFFTNNGKLTESEIKNSDAYKILTNTYNDENEDAKILALKLFIEMNTAKMADQSLTNKDFYTGEIISYLEKHVPSSESIGLSEEVINEYKNHYAKILVDAIKDIVDSFFSKATSCFQVSDLYDLYGSVTGTVNKANEIVDYMMASIESIFLIYENEYAGRYGYFQSYLNNRSDYSSQSDEIFQTIMEYNRLACSDSNWLSEFLNVFSFITHKDSFTNHFDLMDSWAEFTYQLGVYIGEKNNSDSGEGSGTSTEFEVNSISFAVDNYSLFLNYTLVNPATAYPINATNRDIAYSSSNTSIATVDSSGKITPVNPGTVVIYASTANGTTGNCTITILPYRATEITNGYEITTYAGAEKKVVIPQSAQGKAITSIGRGAFSGCSSLTSITIPDGITSIGERTFDDCRSLTNITIPNSVTSIGDFAFSDCSSLTSITIPNSVTSIGKGAFSGCSSLSSITIPDGITSIGWRAFYDCSSLTSITIPNSVMSIGDYVFSGCSSLTNITMPNGVTSIGNAAFKGCNSLTSITIPNSVTSIGNEAFLGCSSLSSITIPNSVTSIGDYAFLRCSSLISINVGAYNPSYSSKDGVLFNKDKAEIICYPSGKSGEYITPNSVTSIRARAFLGCSGLTSITIPNSVTSIGDSTFKYCSSLANITIPNSVTSIGDYVFEGCSSLTNITMPNSITSIGIAAFRGCCSLTNIIIPNGVTSIGGDAFQGCSSLTNIIIPNTITSIENDVFSDCSSLTSVTIPESVTSIGWFAFSRCSSLTNITMPNSVTSIGVGAFADCGLKYVFYSGSESDWGNIKIYDSNACLTNSYIHYNTTDHTWQFELDTMPTSYTDGILHGTCIYCNAVQTKLLPYLKFSSAALTLYDNLSINYKASKSFFEENGYSNPYVVFSMNGEERKVTEYAVVGDNYVFTFSDIAPHQMNDTIFATLYAEYDGDTYSSETKEYSVAEYCYNMLSKYKTDEYAKLRTLLVDLLNYGAESQMYTDYRTDSLVNASLTTEQLAWGTIDPPELHTVQDTAYQVIEKPTVTWKGAGLNLQNSVTMRFKLAAESIDGLTVKVTSESGEWMIASESFEETAGGYYVFFDGLNAGQMSDSVYLTVYKGDTAVSDTIRYSIESYAYAKQSSGDTALILLLNAMMKYGNSAYAYIH